jgi:hypothetical protein
LNRAAALGGTTSGTFASPYSAYESRTSATKSSKTDRPP